MYWRCVHGILVAVVTAGTLLASNLTAAQETIAIETGKVRGTTADGFVAFKGIPYAAPPVGDLRWRPPQPAARWSGVRNATWPGPPCAQTGSIATGVITTS